MFAIGLMVSSLLLAACSSSDSGDEGSGTGNGNDTTKADPHSPEATSFKLGAVGPGVVGHENSFVISDRTAKDFGLSVDLELIPSTPDLLSQVIGNDLQIGATLMWNVFTALESGIDLKVVAQSNGNAPGRFTIEALPDSGIKTPADLKGKRIGVNALNSDSQFRAQYLMTEAGLKATDAKFIALPFANLVPALEKGDVDATVVFGPFLTAAKTELKSTTVGDFGAGPLKDVPSIIFVTTAKYAEQNPNTIAAFQCSLWEANKLITDDNDYYEEILRDPKYQYGMTPAEIKANIKISWPTATDLDAMQLFFKIYKDATGKTPPVKDIKSILLPQTTGADCS